MTQDEKYMKEAIKQAKKAAAIEEVPIGCVIVCEDKIIARSYNKRNLKKNIHMKWKYVKNCAGPDSAGCHRVNEPESRMCGLGFECFANRRL